MKKTKTSAKVTEWRKARSAQRAQESEHFKSFVELEKSLLIIQEIIEHLPFIQSPHPKLSTLLRSTDVSTRPAQPRSRTFAQQLGYIEEAYMVDGPPMSPITYDIFWCWAMFDIKHKPKGESLLHQLSQKLPELSPYIRPLQDSHFGIYICEDYRLSNEGEIDDHDTSNLVVYLLLREVVTGRRVTVILKQLLAFPPGQALMLRLAELQRPPQASGEGVEKIYASICTPYVLNAPEEEWVSYFNRTLPKDQSRREASYLRLMRSERGLLLWLEYIQAAYHGDTHHDPQLDLAIFLSGVPDRPESLPHGDMAKANLLKAKR